MADFSGSQYLALDSDGLGDGGTNDTQPLDSLVEHGVKNNTQYLKGRNPGTSMSFHHGRKFCTGRRGTLHQWRHWIPPDTDKLRVWALGEVGFDDPNGNYGQEGQYYVDFIFSVVGTSFSGNDVKRVFSKLNDDRWFSLDVNARNLTAGEWVVCQLKMQSSVGDKFQDADGSFNNGGRWSNNSDSSSTYDLDDTEDWQSQVLQGQALTLDPMEDENGVMYSWPAAQYGDDYVYEQKYATYFDFKALDVEVERAGEVPFESSDLTHRVPYRAQDSSYQQVREIQKEYDRRKCVAIGWNGQDLAHVEEDGIPQNRAEKWGIYSSLRTNDEILSCPFMMDTESDSGVNPTVEVKYSTLSAQILENRFTKGLESDFDLEKLSDVAGRVNWTADLTLKQFPDGSSAPNTLGQKTVEFEDTLFPLDDTGRWPILQALYCREQQSASGQLAVNSVEPDEVFQEGLLYVNDLGLLTPRTSSFAVEDNWVKDYPVYLTIDNISIDTTKGNDPVKGTSNIVEDAIMCIPAISIWEVPE